MARWRMSESSSASISPSLTRRANCSATSPLPAGVYLKTLNSISSLFGTGSRKSTIASDVFGLLMTLYFAVG
jgi:hypothetical protein